MRTPNYKALYDKHRAAALALPEEEVQICRADPRVVFANLKLGHKGVLGTPALVTSARAHLPKIPMKQVLELPDLGRALVYASGKVVGRVAGPREIEAKLEFIREPREQMLAQAEVLARRGKLDKDAVARVRAGSGKYDSAHDVVTLVGMYTEHQKALAGLHPFTTPELGKYREAGEWLLEVLTPDGARAEPVKRQKPEAERVRDGVWTLIVARHPYLRKIGFYFHGDEVDRLVPRLQSRVAPTAVATAEEESATEEEVSEEGEQDEEGEAEAKEEAPRPEAKAKGAAKAKGEAKPPA